MLLAEANQWPEDTKDYFGEGDECHMAFHFPLMPRMYMALAQEDRFPITDIMRQTPEIPENCQWAIFLRNHDELTLEMVTDRERDYLWQTYAADRRARINLGIRRRLAPLLERDRRRIELMNCLLLSMPGTPVIYYGDEIGMGDNIHLGDRDGVRTPMQWSPDRNGGFSRADPDALVLPPIMDPLYGYEAVNVEAQIARSAFAAQLDAAHAGRARAARASAAARCASSIPKNRKVLAYLREYDRRRRSCASPMCRARPGGRTRSVRVRRPCAGRADRRLGCSRRSATHLSADPAALWLLLVHAGAGERAAVVAYAGAGAAARIRDAGAAQTASPTRLDDRRVRVLERDVLPAYLAKRRWFAAKDQSSHSVADRLPAPLPGGDRELLLAEIEVADRRRHDRWLLPLSMQWEDEPTAPLPRSCARARAARPPGRPADRRLCAAEFRARDARPRWREAQRDRLAGRRDRFVPRRRPGRDDLRPAGRRGRWLRPSSPTAR